MDAGWIDQIRRTLEQKSTPELLRIWAENDKEQWTEEAFVAVRQILEARGETPGPQGQVSSQSRPAPVVSRQRPGCVTAFAILTGVAGVLYALSSLVSVLLSAGDEAVFLGAGVTWVFAGLYIAVAIGLWRLHNWARITFIVLQSLGMLLLLVFLFNGVTAIPALVGLLVGGYSIYWFAVNGAVFKPATTVETPLTPPG